MPSVVPVLEDMDVWQLPKYYSSLLEFVLISARLFQDTPNLIFRKVSPNPGILHIIRLNYDLMIIINILDRWQLIIDIHEGVS